MTDLQVVVKQQAGVIEWNYDELKAALQERMDLYKDAVVTEEGKNLAKKEVAALRNMKKAIDEKRKDVKKQCLEPYDEFNAKVMALMTIIDEPISLIDSQVKAFDEKRREQRRFAIREIYGEVVGDMDEYLSLERIYNSKWENATTSIKSIREDMEKIAADTKAAVLAISSMQSDAVPKALDMYKHDLSMAAAVAYVNDYERQKAEILRAEDQRRREEDERKRLAEIERAKQEERRRMEEEERIRQEEHQKAADEIQAKQETAETGFILPEDPLPGTFEKDDQADSLPFVQPDTVTVYYKIVASPEELQQVETMLNSFGVLFERRDA